MALTLGAGVYLRKLLNPTGAQEMPQAGRYLILANHAGEWSYVALDVPGGSTRDGTIIQQFGYHGGPNQQWELTVVGNDVFTIRNVHSNKNLDVPGGYPISGLPIQQFTPHGGSNQQWRIESFPAVSGPSVFRPAYNRIFSVATGMALDVPYGSQAWRVQIQQFTPHQGWNQTWLLRNA